MDERTAVPGGRRQMKCLAYAKSMRVNQQVRRGTRRAPSTASNSPFTIDLRWKGGFIKADVDRGGDPSWIEPVRMAFDALLKGRLGNQNVKLRDGGTENENKD